MDRVYKATVGALLAICAGGLILIGASVVVEHKGEPRFERWVCEEWEGQYICKKYRWY